MKATWDITGQRKMRSSGGIKWFIMKYPLQEQECVQGLGWGPRNWENWGLFLTLSCRICVIFYLCVSFPAHVSTHFKAVLWAPLLRAVASFGNPAEDLNEKMGVIILFDYSGFCVSDEAKN